MARYNFQCQNCQCVFEVERPMAESSDPLDCAYCEVPAKRLFHVPHIGVHKMAVDIMNEMAAGEGDIVPTLTREQQTFYARELAKQPKGTKEYRGPTISTGSSPVATPYQAE